MFFFIILGGSSIFKSNFTESPCTCKGDGSTVTCWLTDLLTTDCSAQDEKRNIPPATTSICEHFINQYVRWLDDILFFLLNFNLFNKHAVNGKAKIVLSRQGLRRLL